MTGAPHATVAEVAAALRGYNGHRTVWIDPQSRLWHCEPEQELEALGWRYVGTFFRPADEVLEIAVGRVLLGRPTMRIPDTRHPAAFSGLAPA